MKIMPVANVIIISLFLVSSCGSDKEKSDYVKAYQSDHQQLVVSDCAQGDMSGYTSPSKYKWKLDQRSNRLEIIGGNGNSTWGLSLLLSKGNEADHWTIWNGESESGKLTCVEELDSHECFAEGVSFDVVIGQNTEGGECIP